MLTEKKQDLTWGCDANSHNVMTNTYIRSESLLAYITSNNLITINSGNEPTFVTIE